MPKRVLIVEDELSIAETIEYALRTEQFEPTICLTGSEALRLFEQEPVDFIILDVGLPDMSGFDVCRALRRSGATPPLLFLTARDGEIDRVVGLELGADDYVTKPFSPRELVARVRAILRRATPAMTSGRPPSIKRGNMFEHDADRRLILCRGEVLDLSRNEYHLLLTMMRQPGRVLSREQLLAQAWPDPGAAGDRTVDAHIKSLRAKIRERAPDIDPIETRRGHGYAFNPPEPA